MLYHSYRKAPNKTGTFTSGGFVTDNSTYQTKFVTIRQSSRLATAVTIPTLLVALAAILNWLF